MILRRIRDRYFVYIFFLLFIKVEFLIVVGFGEFKGLGVMSWFLRGRVEGIFWVDFMLRNFRVSRVELKGVFVKSSCYSSRE